ncbi:MAG TPA: protein kinase, partial [Schlesneria sp.]
MTADDKAAVRTPAGTGAALSLSELKRLGKYSIDKKIGAGGMGTVFLARDTELKRVVALKVLARDKAENPILVRRFRAEAQAAAQLRHPNIVAVYDSGEADGYLYIAMEYVEGRDLFEMVSRRGVVPVRRSIEVVKQVAAALQHAFEQNIVHRDIKPSNLLIRPDGVVKLTDLGLARSIDDTLETNITRAGTTVGTVDYMAPEQARNSKLADIRSDLYSLGCTWYQMLTGSPPYPDGSVTNKLQAHAIKPIPDPRDKNPQVPEGLIAVLGRLMAKKPEDRYQTPADLLDDLAHSTLTDAAISREIFADSDSEISTNIAKFEDEAFSDDGYFELNDVREVSETPIEVPIPPQLEAPTRKKNLSPTTSTPEETQPVYYKSKPRPPSTAAEDKSTQSEPQTQKAKPRPATEVPSDSQPVQYKAKTRPTKDEPKDPEPTGSPRRTSRVAAQEEEDGDPVTRKPKPRSDKPETNESSTGARTKPATAKPADSKPAKPNDPSHKPLPPKRQPVEEAVESKPLLSKELLRNLTAIAALALLIIGVGWVISRYGSNLDVEKTPFGPPPDSGANQPVPNTAPAVAANPNEPASTENPSVTVANTAPGTAR